MTHIRFHTILALLALVVMGLASVNWYYEPEAVRSWIIGMAAMPFIWLVVILIGQRRPLESYNDGERRFFVGAVLIAGVVLASAQCLKLVERLDLFAPGVLERAWGVGVGVLLVVMGNAMPKVLSPLAARCTTASATAVPAARGQASQKQSVQRVAGWSFVLGGLGYAIAWLALPVKQADTVATLICLAALAVVVLRVMWAFTAGRGATPASRR